MILEVVYSGTTASGFPGQGDGPRACSNCRTTCSSLDETSSAPMKRRPCFAAAKAESFLPGAMGRIPGPGSSEPGNYQLHPGVKMAAAVSLCPFIVRQSGDHAVSAVPAKPRFAVDQQQLLAGRSAPWIPPRTRSPVMVDAVKGANPGQVRMPQTPNEFRQTLRASQHEHPAGSFQGMGGEARQVRQQWAGPGIGGGNVTMASTVSGSTNPCRPATAD